MPVYEYGRIAVLAKRLQEAGIDQEMVDRIMEGGEGIRRTTPPARKSEWLRQAMLRMDQLLDQPTRHAVREACACCLGGKRLETTKRIAKQFSTVEERVRAANEAKHVFGHSVSAQSDGRVLVRFAPEGLEHYRCPCQPQAAEPFSLTYCYCCGGHVKHHLQTALGCQLTVEVCSSALASGGKSPCTFLLAVCE